MKHVANPKPLLHPRCSLHIQKPPMEPDVRALTIKWGFSKHCSTQVESFPTHVKWSCDCLRAHPGSCPIPHLTLIWAIPTQKKGLAAHDWTARGALRGEEDGSGARLYSILQDLAS